MINALLRFCLRGWQALDARQRIESVGLDVRVFRVLDGSQIQVFPGYEEPEARRSYFAADS